jgi:hypothetical protein
MPKFNDTKPVCVSFVHKQGVRMVHCFKVVSTTEVGMSKIIQEHYCNKTEIAEKRGSCNVPGKCVTVGQYCFETGNFDLNTVLYRFAVRADEGDH